MASNDSQVERSSPSNHDGSVFVGWPDTEADAFDRVSATETF